MRQLAISLTIWWLAVVPRSGEAIILEYRTKAECQVIHSVYNRVSTVKVTDCRWKKDTTNEEHTG